MDNNMFDSYIESLFLAELFGLYLVILSLVFLSRADHYRTIILNTAEDSYFHLLSRSISLFIGIILVLAHNKWVMQPRVFVTIGCWLFLLKAILWLAAPEKMLYFLRKLCAGRGFYYLAVAFGVIGVMLIIRGFHFFLIKAHGLSTLPSVLTFSS